MFDYKKLEKQFNEFFNKTNSYYDTYYFIWTSVANILLTYDNDHLLLEEIMNKYTDEIFVNDIISPILTNDHSYQEYKYRTSFGERINDLGTLWIDIIKKNDASLLLQLASLLEDYLIFLYEVFEYIKKNSDINFTNKLDKQKVMIGNKKVKKLFKDIYLTIHILYSISDYKCIA